MGAITFFKRFFLLVLILWSGAYFAHAALEPDEDGGAIPDEIYKMIEERKVYLKEYCDTYDCKNFSDDLEKHISQEVLARQKTDSYWNRYRVYYAVYHELESTDSYRGYVNYRGQIFKNLKLRHYRDGHAVIAIRDQVEKFICFIEPQSSSRNCISLDFDDDGYVDYYENIARWRYNTVSPSEGVANIAIFNSRASAQNYGWN